MYFVNVIVALGFRTKQTNKQKIKKTKTYADFLFGFGLRSRNAFYPPPGAITIEKRAGTRNGYCHNLNELANSDIRKVDQSERERESKRG